MSDEQPKNPLHGVTLKAIVEDLVARRGFEDLASRIPIRCFTHDPSVKSSLKFLRRTPWARTKVERLYVRDKAPARSPTKADPKDRRRPPRALAEAAMPHSGYLDRLMRRDSFQALWPLFRHADKPAKEMTESFAALAHLRPLLPETGPFRVIHIGDGAHCRTAALFALKTQGENIAVDPTIHEERVAGWQQEQDVERFAWRKAKIEDVIDELNALPEMPVFVTFVHAHVPVDAVLDRLRWTASFSLICCVPGHQRSTRDVPTETGTDLGVLSKDRDWEVLQNQPS